MTKPHRLAGAHMRIKTSLSERDVAKIIVSLASPTPTTGASVRLESADGSRLNFAIRMFGDRAENMTFRVDIGNADKGTVAVSQIETYKTKQEKLFMLIPLFPAEMVSYVVYKSFLQKAIAAVKEKDRSAQGTLVEAG